MPFTAIQGAALHAILSAHSATLTANDESLINTLSPKEAEDLRRALSLLNRVKESTVQRLSGAADIEPGEAVKIVTEGRRATREELEDAVDHRKAKRQNHPVTMLEIKRLNEHRPVGVKINCPTCNEQITKARYNTNFCSNKGAGNCKDAFYQATQGDRHKKG